jgi:membrane-associated protease RseP (regulator of RpoE activity)
VSARINVEGVKQVSPELLAGLFGTLSPEFGVLVAGPVANFVPRSTQFVSGNIMLFSNVPPGDYLFDISQGVLRDDMRRLHVKSVRLGSNDALETINIPPGTNDVVLEVVLTTQTGTVDGIALGRAGDPAANATVVLVPTNARKRTPRYQAVVTGSDGKFRFQEIPPGDYKLFAWEDIETGAWENAEFMRAYESRGRAVRVAEGSREEVPLSVIYNP